MHPGSLTANETAAGREPPRTEVSVMLVRALASVLLQRGFTLEELAAASGVSRSMLSEVERGSRVPTVLILDRIATGLGTSIARLLRVGRFA